MEREHFDQGDVPAVRRAAGEGRAISGYACPFCGEQALLLSSEDIAQDGDRVEVLLR